MFKTIIATILFVSVSTATSFAHSEEAADRTNKKICTSLRSAIIAANGDLVKAQVTGTEASQEVLNDLLAPYNKMNCGELLANSYLTCKQILEAQKVQIRNISAGKYTSINEANRKLDALYNRYDQECK